MAEGRLSIAFCPRCQNRAYVRESRVVRKHGQMVMKRRRYCRSASCAYHFNTYEGLTPEHDLPRILDLVKQMRGIHTMLGSMLDEYDGKQRTEEPECLQNID